MTEFSISKDHKEDAGAIEARELSIESQSDSQPTIDWANINYPPFLRFFHYDPDELPSPARRLAQLMNTIFLTTVIRYVTVLKTKQSANCLKAGGAGGVRVAYAFLNMVILIPLAGFAFYQGYSGIVTTSPTRSMVFYILQGITTFLAFIFVIYPYEGHNGLTSFAVMHRDKYAHVSAGIQTYWTIAVATESLIWLCVAALGALAIYKVSKFNPYHSQNINGITSA